MQMRRFMQAMMALWLIVFLIACSGGKTRLIQSHLDDAHADKSIADVLVIAIIQNREVREIFEKYFVQRLKTAGVEAISSVQELPVKEGEELEEGAILKVIDKYGNKTVAITHLVGMDQAEVFSRGRPQYYFNYHGFYNYSLSYVYWPIIYGERVQLSLETRLYDVKTRSLIWAGESRTSDPETTGQAIGQIVDVVIKELEKTGLLPKQN